MTVAADVALKFSDHVDRIILSVETVMLTAVNVLFKPDYYQIIVFYSAINLCMQ